jgi:hypothetical protein
MYVRHKLTSNLLFFLTLQILPTTQENHLVVLAGAGPLPFHSPHYIDQPMDSPAWESVAWCVSCLISPAQLQLWLKAPNGSGRPKGPQHSISLTAAQQVAVTND